MFRPFFPRGKRRLALEIGFTFLLSAMALSMVSLSDELSVEVVEHAAHQSQVVFAALAR